MTVGAGSLKSKNLVVVIFVISRFFLNKALEVPLKRFLSFSLVLLVPLGFFIGCNSGKLPVAPSMGSVRMNVSIPVNPGSKLLGSVSNEIYYSVSGTGSPVTGVVGPIASAGVTGTISFSITLPSTAYNFLALQLNDAPTHQPLAIGASPLSFSNSSSNLTVEMGALNLNCYSEEAFQAGDGLNFENHDMFAIVTPQPTPAVDTVVNSDGTDYEFDDPGTNNSIAYMGNGDLVRYANVPPATAFASSSSIAKQASSGGITTSVLKAKLAHLVSGKYTSTSPMEAGDVYCVKLAVAGYAWVIVTNPGNLSANVGPNFSFRVNTTVPYYAFERTQADTNGLCSGFLAPTATWTFTITNTPTQTFTATISPTATFTRTITSTGTLSSTPTVTVTPTFTNTTTVTATATPSTTVTFQDITSSIGGAPVAGDTTGLLNNYSETVPGNATVFGASSPDIAYSITLTSAASLDIKCISTFVSVLYVRTNPTDPSTTIAFDEFPRAVDENGMNSELVTGTLPVGTYYIIVDGYGASGDYGPFQLYLSDFIPQCNITPLNATALGETIPDANFANANNLQNVTSTQDALGVGSANYYFNTADYWSFTAEGPNSYNNYEISLDCFDDGTSSTAMSFYIYDSGQNFIAASPDNYSPGQPNQYLLTNVPYGAQYYVVVQPLDSTQPGGDYHLIVHYAATPTTIDITNNIDGSSVSGTTVGAPDNYNQSINSPDLTQNNIGQGAGDVAYQFTLNSPKQLFISLCGGSFSGSVMYLRSSLTDPNTLLDFSEGGGYCTYPEFTTDLLAPGTYYLIIDGQNSDTQGSYSLLLSTFTPVCNLNLGSGMAVNEQEPNNDDTYFTNASPLVALNAPMASGTNYIGAGAWNNYLEAVGVWQFTLQNNAYTSISLDCFDDGTGKNSGYFYLETYDSVNQIAVTVDSTFSSPFTNAVSDSLSAGVTYYVVVYSSEDGTDGNYSLIVQPGVELFTNTPTSSPTITFTSTVTFTPTVTSTPTVTPTITFTPNIVAPASIITGSSYGNLQGISAVEVYSGMLYISLDSSPASIQVFNTSSTSDTVNSFTGDFTCNVCHTFGQNGYFGSPEQIAFDSSGYMYVADAGLSGIEKYQGPNDFPGENIGNGTGVSFFTPFGIVVDPSNAIYVTDIGQEKLLKLDGNSAPATQITSWETSTAANYAFSSPWQVAVDLAENVYVADTGHAQVVVFNSSGSLVETIGPGLANPRGVAVCNSCTGPNPPYIYISDSGNNRIVKVDASGNFITAWGGFGTGSGQFAAPAMISIDQSDNYIYVADQGNARVQKFSPQ